MNPKKKPVRLLKKAITALKAVYDTSYKARVLGLESIDEYSFALLIYWNRVEAILKVLKYYNHIEEPYPDKLNFINRSWGILKTAYNNDSAMYENVLGVGGKTTDCLWSIRDQIVHANYAVEKERYGTLKESVIWLSNSLTTNLPESYERAHQQYLQHKKKIIAMANKN